MQAVKESSTTGSKLQQVFVGHKLGWIPYVCPITSAMTDMSKPPQCLTLEIGMGYLAAIQSGATSFPAGSKTEQISKRPGDQADFHPQLGHGADLRICSIFKANRA